MLNLTRVYTATLGQCSSVDTCLHCYAVLVLRRVYTVLVVMFCCLKLDSAACGLCSGQQSAMMRTDAGTCASLSVSLLTTSPRLSNHFLLYTPIDLRFRLMSQSQFSLVFCMKLKLKLAAVVGPKVQLDWLLVSALWLKLKPKLSKLAACCCRKPIWAGTGSYIYTVESDVFLQNESETWNFQFVYRREQPVDSISHLMNCVITWLIGVTHVSFTDCVSWIL